MHIITAYYNIAVHYLKEYLDLDYIPKMTLTNAKTYYGKITYKNNKLHIYLSKWNLDGGMFTDQEDIDEIIDTICHELAHILVWEHGKEHTELTNIFKKIVRSNLELSKIDNNLKSA